MTRYGAQTLARLCQTTFCQQKRLFSVAKRGFSTNDNNIEESRQQQDVTIPPARIILIRHGESLGNVDETTYARTPDWKIELTDKGRAQALAAGQTLSSLLQPHETVLTYCSPYQRTLQSWDILSSCLLQEQVVGMRQEPRLAEQQFGNFQNPMAVLASKEERHVFGRFFYRFPNGESGLDVYSRVTSFLGSMSRDVLQLREHDALVKNQNQNNNQPQDLNILCVTHGLTMRLLVMRYFQLTVEQFEETHNPGNGQMLLLERQYSEQTQFYYYRLHEDSKAILNVHGDVSTEYPVFLRHNTPFPKMEALDNDEDWRS